MQYKEVKSFESMLVGLHIEELRATPIPEKYDVAHLKEIYRCIFQDLPRAGVEIDDY
jgi:fido (protein-threonine AMPylation protein)